MTISESFGRAARRIQQRIHVASQGHLGRHLLSVSCLLLGMNRRRTGRSRVAALGHLADGDRLTVAVLNGARRPPGWLCSLETDARTEIWVARRRLRASAAAVQRDDDAQREQRGRINANNRGHHDRLSGEDRSRGAARRSHAAVSPLETLPRDKPPAAHNGRSSASVAGGRPTWGFPFPPLSWGRPVG
ncbi:MAG: nitroreductase/quinone reductase family protein [Acidimicrobiales bacterium]